MPEITFNLNRSQKFLSKLKKYIAEVNPKSSLYSCDDKLVKYSPIEKIRETIEIKKQEYANYLDERITLQNDLNTIKQSIFKANIESGISDVLSNIELCNFQMNILQKSIKDVLNYPAHDNEYIRAIKDKIDYTSGYFTEPLINADELENKIKELRKKLNELENKRDKLNANMTIKVELNEKTLEILGF